MSSISEEQKSEVISLRQEGRLGREEIASRLGVSPGTVSAIKAHMTMGTYRGAAASEAGTEELIEHPRPHLVLSATYNLHSAQTSNNSNQR